MFKKIVFVLFLLTVSRVSGVAFASPNYVVIGAFSIRSHATAQIEKARPQFPDVKLDYNEVRQLFYVYVLKTNDRKQAIAEALRIQRETDFKDAWVYSGEFGTKGTGVDLQPSNEKQISPEPTIVVKSSPLTEEKKQIPEVKEEATTVVPTLTPTETISVSETPTTKPSVALDPKATSKDFFFRVVKPDGVPAKGAEITVIDLETQRKEYLLGANEPVTLKAVNPSGDMRLECDLAGFRQAVQNVNFKNPLATDGVTLDNDRIIVPFELVRLKKGDYAILYNVFFYKDAAIMRPESKFDLDGLLAMMNENPKYKIRIHGHTNGNAAGRILEPGESKDFFSLTGAKEGAGSAKKLSEKRAITIRDYLVSQGVDISRMTVKAWGGKKPIYDKHHTLASANVRVEVEVLEE